jgi:hypothetical protein
LAHYKNWDGIQIRPKIKNCLFPLYLPTQQKAPTQHILFANFKSIFFK